MKNVLQFRKEIIFISLFIFFSAVSYGQYSITGVSVSPSSPATLITGQNVSVSFNYTKTGGNVRIFARPFYNGSLAPGYAASGSPLYTANSGSGSGTFTLTNPGRVNSIRFQIVDATTNAVLYERFYNATYTFVNYRIYGISVSPVSPATLITGQNVSVSFNYQKISGNVRIFARPFYNGSLAPGYAASGSPLYTANSGSGSGTFTLTAPGGVNSIRFQIVDATTNAVLYERFYNATYTFVNYRIHGITVSPASPATLTTGQNVSVSFNYQKISGDVRIFARPFYNGSLAPGYAASGSPLYTANSGSGSGTFTLTIPGNVNSIRFQIVDATTNAVLYQRFFAVNYTFVNGLRLTDDGLDEENTNSDANTITLEVAPVPADDEITLSTGLEGFSYRLSDVNGTIVRSGQAEAYSKTLDVNDLPAGIYLLQIQNGNMVREKKIVIK